tara:strand:+ start:646 stop:897 length:252 start_codon:yes stop_codon:yes gene_type:complete
LGNRPLDSSAPLTFGVRSCTSLFLAINESKYHPIERIGVDIKIVTANQITRFSLAEPHVKAPIVARVIINKILDASLGVDQPR